MAQNTYHINCTNPFDYLDSLQELGNSKQKLWNGFELTFDKDNVKSNCQIFINDDLHFYRTDSSVSHNILLKIRKEKIDQEYIDFRIDCFGNTRSIILDKELQLESSHVKEQSLHIFIKKKLISLNKENFDIKRSNASQCHRLNNIAAEVLSIPAIGNSNALRIEGKMLELSSAYLDFLHRPIESAPSFLSCDYKVECINNAKMILEGKLAKPPVIKDLAKRVGINSNQLKIGFKYLFGTSIRQYVINLRLELAKHLIHNTGLPLGEICNQVGYVNHGHFSKLYKEKFGLSPINDRVR